MSRCTRIGCEAEATHAIKIVVPDARIEDVAAAEGLLLGAEVCERHAADHEGAPVDYCNEMVSLLANVLRFPEARPDVSEAYTAVLALGSPEHCAFMDLERRAN